MRKQVLCGSALIGALAPAVVFAQDGAAVSATAEAAPEEGLTDIIVTAQRRAESLQRVGVAVTAVSGDDLISAGVTTADNLTKIAPSLVAQQAGGGMAFYLRGVGTRQGNAFAENPVAFNFNGVYIARPTASSGMFYDIERVEVVKGPQGTLYGRNATGGAINVLPSRPKLGSFSGNLSAEYGNYDTRRVAGAVNLPLGEVAALRVAGQVIDRDGYLSDGTDDEVGQAARISLLLQPSDQWSALLVADYFHQGGKGPGGALVPGSFMPQAPDLDRRIGGADARSLAALAQFANANPPFGAFLAGGLVQPPQPDSYTDSSFYGVSATIEADLGFGTLTVQPAYRRSEPKFLHYLTGFENETIEVDDQMSLEVRVASNEDQRLRYVLGGYYFYEDQDASNFFNQGRLSTTFFTPQLQTESLAAFGQATFDLTDSVRLIGGARYTRETRDQRTAIASGNPANPNPPLSAPFEGHLKFNKVTWKAGVEWDAGPQSLVYANVATGFKAGGFFVAAPPNNIFQPEELTAYTVGAKNRFLDNKLQVNAEAFYWDYKDQQITFVGPIATPTGVAPGGVTVNAGQARIYGAELELMFAPTHRDTFSANIQYLNGKYNSLGYTAISSGGAPIRTGCSASNGRLANPGTPDPARLFDIDCAGRSMINSPKWIANLSYEHIFELGGDYELIAGARTRVESSTFVNIDFLPEMRRPSYMMSDASLTLEGPDDRWSLTAFINNIEDKTVISAAATRPIFQVVYTSLRPPRTYGIRARFNF